MYLAVINNFNYNTIFILIQQDWVRPGNEGDNMILIG